MYTVKYLGKCPVSGVRLYDMPESSFLEHQPKTLIATEYDMNGRDLVVSWHECNNSRAVYEQAMSLAKENWLPGPAMVGKTESVVIRGRRWFDSTAGNTYFSAEAVVNGQTVARIAFEYGYDSQYMHSMTDKLEKLGFLPGREKYRHGSEALWNYATRVGITENCSATDVSRKRDL